MAIRLSRIYTRSGDRGETGLIGGARISKSSLRLEAYGTADELNAFVGLIRTLAMSDQIEDRKVKEETATVFPILQNKLFDIGSVLATPPQADAAGMPTVDAQDVRDLERRIDLYNEVLQPLDSFTLPGGNLLNSYAHIARTVCRRLERIVIRLHEKEPVDRQVRAWLNRLSDYFFVYSRWVIQQLGDSEFLWQKECS